MNDLLIKFPLDTQWLNFFVHTFNEISNDLSKTVGKELNMALPDHVSSQSCQVFLYIALDLENHLAERYSPLVKIMKNHYAKQILQMEDNLLKLMHHSHDRGVPKDSLIIYISHYVDAAHNKVFPGHPIILG